MSARQPAATAMAAMTMDHLSGGRFILGLGVSGPQVVEGWYGMPFAKPLARTREYIGDPARHLGAQGPGDGRRRALPAAAARRHRASAKPLKSSIHPLREDIPIYLGAEGPKNIALCAELCDGWLAMLFSPGARAALPRRARARASRAPGARRTARRLRGRRDGAADRLRRRRRGGRRAAPVLRALLRRDGRERHELPRQRGDPHGLRGGGRRDRRTLYLDGKKDEAGGEGPARADRGACR